MFNLSRTISRQFGYNTVRTSIPSKLCPGMSLETQKKCIKRTRIRGNKKIIVYYGINHIFYSNNQLSRFKSTTKNSVLVFDFWESFHTKFLSLWPTQNANYFCKVLTIDLTSLTINKWTIFAVCMRSTRVMTCFFTQFYVSKVTNIRF
jgi:hypothetical protein